MADLKTQHVVGDLGSQQVQQLIVSYNALLVVLGDMITSMKTTAGFVADLQTIATTAETALEAGVYYQAQDPNIPAGRIPTAV
jgi:hypothetical protein